MQYLLKYIGQVLLELFIFLLLSFLKIVVMSENLKKFGHGHIRNIEVFQLFNVEITCLFELCRILKDNSIYHPLNYYLDFQLFAWLLSFINKICITKLNFELFFILDYLL